MLKRISHIKNVGAFHDCQARPVEFDKITLIYGRNTYGKSTLGDIFSSLQKNDSALILSRSSIPGDGSDQKVNMGFAADGETERDGQVLFQCGTWEQQLKASHLLRVYDDSFFHEHVFAARKFTRDTKVKFSDFILGEQGVQKAKEIAEKKSEKRQHATRKKALLRDAFNDIEDVDKFVATDLPDNIEELKSTRDALREEFSALSKQKKEAAKITNRLELSEINIDTSIVDDMKEINNIFQSSLDTHHDEAKARLDEHIRQHFNGDKSAERWLQQGIVINTGKSCGFCGQDLGDDALALLQVYRDYFNEAFQKHENDVKNNLVQLQTKVNIKSRNNVKTTISQNDVVIQVYPEIKDNELFVEAFSIFKKSSSKIVQLMDGIERLISEYIKEYQLKSEKKVRSPHQTVDEIDINGLVDLVSKFNELAQSYNTACQNINSVISEFKKGINDENINKRLDEITKLGNSVSQSIQRYDKNESCIEYKDISQKIVTLDENIPKLETSLRDEQSAYLEKFFSKINKYFSSLGSNDFALAQGYDRSGHTPVYYLKVKFRKKDVSESDLDKVFSESDRRALGLAVFMASLDAISDEDLAKTVVVFDDPVTSFDDHRVTQTHMKFMELSDRCEQIILLSHFKEGVAHFIRTHGFSNNNRIKLIVITKDHQSSKLEVGDNEAFIRTVHEDARENIIDFIDRKTDHLSCSPRVFIEAEISYRFGQQIRVNNITNNTLCERIDALLAANIISDGTATRLHHWRESLNPEHHVLPGDDIEDQRTTAREFMNFVYNELVPDNI